MQLVKVNPFQELANLEHDMKSLFRTGWGMMPALSGAPDMDLYEEDGNLVAEVNLPNFKKTEVSVKVDDDMLEVAAKHEEKKEQESKRRYMFRESSNQYWRRVALPEGAMTEKAEASFKDGILKVSMPLAKHKQPKSIDLK